MINLKGDMEAHSGEVSQKDYTEYDAIMHKKTCKKHSPLLVLSKICTLFTMV